MVLMSEIETIIEQLKRTFDGRSWHGPSFMYALEGVDKVQARFRTIEGRHTIWDIVEHMRFWVDLVLDSIRGVEMPDFSGLDDWPSSGEGEEAWSESLARLKDSIDNLVEAIHSFGEADLDGLVPGREYTYRFMLFGLVHHNIYHVGQIAILKKKT